MAVNQKTPGERVTVLAYADDVTLLAANRSQAAEMLKALSKALEGLNLELLAEKCSALWTKAPDGSENEKYFWGSPEFPSKPH